MFLFPIYSKEDVEKCKQKDLLKEMLKEMTGEFPALSRVFVQERDTFLSHSLKNAAEPIPYKDSDTGKFFPVLDNIKFVFGFTENAREFLKVIF